MQIQAITNRNNYKIQYPRFMGRPKVATKPIQAVADTFEAVEENAGEESPAEETFDIPEIPDEASTEVDQKAMEDYDRMFKGKE